jgi:hypothetical protein
VPEDAPANCPGATLRPGRKHVALTQARMHPMQAQLTWGLGVENQGPEELCRVEGGHRCLGTK